MWRPFNIYTPMVTALLEATNSWAMKIDRGFVNAVVFLDLKKVSDNVDHDIMGYIGLVLNSLLLTYIIEPKFVI